MQLTINTYIAGTSAVHRLDARVKIILLAAYSVALFFLDTWAGMALAAALFAGALAVSRIAPGRVFGLVIPVYVLVAMAIVFNMFVFATPEMLGQAPADGAAAASAVSAIAEAGEGVGAAVDANTSLGTVAATGSAAGVGTGVDAIAETASAASVEIVASTGIYPFIGSFAFSVPGLLRGCFYGARILLLVFASLLVSFTSTSTELTEALNAFLRPLRRFRVPTDDVAMVFSIALRFIPVTAEEFCRVRDAQWSRGSKFGEGTIWERLSAWQTVLIPLLVGLFRRADALAQAMDARCYGACERTSLSARSLTPCEVMLLFAGLALLAALCLAL